MKIHMPSKAELKAIEARNSKLDGGSRQMTADDARMRPTYRYAPRQARAPSVDARVKQLAEAEG